MYKRGVVMSGVVSLTMGNSRFPFGYRFVAYAENIGYFLLGKRFFLSQF